MFAVIISVTIVPLVTNVVPVAVVVTFVTMFVVTKVTNFTCSCRGYANVRTLFRSADISRVVFAMSGSNSGRVIGCSVCDFLLVSRSRSTLMLGYMARLKWATSDCLKF